MPVFDFKHTPDEKKAQECTYTTFRSNETEATAEKPMLVLDILQFPGKIRRLICLRDHIIHAIRGNVVLRQLGNNGFHLTDVTWLFDISF